MSRRPTTSDYAWLSAAGLATLLLLGGLFYVTWSALVAGSWLLLLGVPIGVVFWYWMIAGCWRRTAWGRT